MIDENIEIISLNKDNIESEHICCAIGNDKTNRERADVKKEWLKKRFADGHVFKKASIRGKVFIEYVPAENAWSPVDASGYMMIHCLWVSGRYKKQGLANWLMEECFNDSKNMNGVVVMSASTVKPYLVDKKFYLKKGFEVCDSAPPFYELLVKKFKGNAPTPKFKPQVKNGTCDNKKGLTFYYSDQCPFSEPYVNEMIQAAESLNVPYKKIKITTKEEAQNLIAPSAILTVFYNGEYLTYEHMPMKKFEAFLKENCAI